MSSAKPGNPAKIQKADLAVEAVPAGAGVSAAVREVVAVAVAALAVMVGAAAPVGAAAVTSCGMHHGGGPFPGDRGVPLLFIRVARFMARASA